MPLPTGPGTLTPSNNVWYPLGQRFFPEKNKVQRRTDSRKEMQKGNPEKGNP